MIKYLKGLFTKHDYDFDNAHLKNRKVPSYAEKVDLYFVAICKNCGKEIPTDYNTFGQVRFKDRYGCVHNIRARKLWADLDRERTLELEKDIKDIGC